MHVRLTLALSGCRLSLPTCNGLALALGFMLSAFSCLPAQSQNMKRVNYTLQELTKPEYFGRGYTKEGHEKAADFLKHEFQQAGLEKVNGSYEQAFTMPVNLIEEELQLTINGKTLKPGYDFIASSYSHSGEGASRKLFRLQNLEKTDKLCRPSKSQKVLLSDKSFFQSLFKADAQYLKQALCADLWLEVRQDTPIATLSQSRFSPPWFQVREQALPCKAEAIKNVSYKLENKIEQVESQNVWGMLPGRTDTFLLLTAHYDHLGGQGKEAFFPGANDNASGIAMLLELMHYFAQRKDSLRHNLMFIAFSGEENGLAGSKYCSENFPFPLDQVGFLLNIDLMSTGDIGVTAVNATCCPDTFKLLQALNTEGNYLPRVRKRGQAPNSDHYYFNQAGVPGFFVYTEGKEKTHYHSVYDTAPTLPLSKFKEVFALFTDFVWALQ